MDNNWQLNLKLALAKVERIVENEEVSPQDKEDILNILVKIKNVLAEEVLSQMENSGNLNSDYDEMLKLANLETKGEEENDI